MFRHIIMFATGNRGRSMHPLEKLILAFSPVILLGFTRNLPLLAANIGVFLFLHHLFRTPWPFVLRYSLALIGFSGSSSLVLLFDYPFPFVLALLLRTTFSALALTLFLLTTPPGDIFTFFARFPTLRDLCTVAQAMEHFILVMEEEFHHLVRSMHLRGGFRTWRLAAQNSGKIGALLFKNALNHYERTKEALEARLFHGAISRGEEPYALSFPRFLVILLYLAGIGYALRFLR